MPNRENASFAYRTELSARNEETWRFAHLHISKIWIRLGILTLVLSSVLLVVLRARYTNFFLWIIVGQMVFLCISAFFVEILLKAAFDADGNAIL